MSREPVIEERSEQPYLGTRQVMPMSDFALRIPEMTAKVTDQLATRGLRPSGKPFLRYLVIDMPERMDVELGVPVQATPDATDGVEARVLPAGRYAVLTYVGVRDGVTANQRLMDWIAARGERVDSHPAVHGEAFEARYEAFLTDAAVEPDQDKWDIEVAIKLLPSAMP